MQKPWWGTFELPVDEETYWEIGPLRLWIRRSAEELRVASANDGDRLASNLVVAERPAPAHGVECASVRFGFRRIAPGVRLLPVVADRPIVLRSETPFVVPAGEEATLFVSTPLWLRLDVDAEAGPLHELPLFRPSDTWFGPSTLTGEVCYAVRTSARRRLSELPLRPHRAVSVVCIRNRARSPLPLERLRLPMPHFSVYSGKHAHLWTEAVTLTRDVDGDIAAIQIASGGPEQADGATRLSEPRDRSAPGFLSRTFGGFLGLMGDRDDD